MYLLTMYSIKSMRYMCPLHIQRQDDFKFKILFVGLSMESVMANVFSYVSSSRCLTPASCVSVSGQNKRGKIFAPTSPQVDFFQRTECKHWRHGAVAEGKKRVSRWS